MTRSHHTIFSPILQSPTSYGACQKKTTTSNWCQIGIRSTVTKTPVAVCELVSEMQFHRLSDVSLPPIPFLAGLNSWRTRKHCRTGGEGKQYKEADRKRNKTPRNIPENVPQSSLLPLFSFSLLQNISTFMWHGRGWWFLLFVLDIVAVYSFSCFLISIFSCYRIILLSKS